MACLLFILVLEKTVRDAGLQTRGIIFNRLVQLLAFADDMDIIGRSKRSVTEAFLALEAAGRRFGLEINQEKTKYMVSGQTPLVKGVKVSFGPYEFEQVAEFTYLGSQVTADNHVGVEVKRRILSANRCYYALRKQLTSSLVSRRTKLILYKTLIRPVLTYGSETWTTTRTEDKELLIFERKVLRRILGGVFINNEWRRRTNAEVYRLYDDLDVATVIKLGRLRWAGHVARMAEDAIPRSVLTEQLYGRRGVGRPRLRWMDCVTTDARSLGIRNWMAAAQNRDAWRLLLEEVRTRQRVVELR